MSWSRFLPLNLNASSMRKSALSPARPPNNLIITLNLGGACASGLELSGMCRRTRDFNPPHFSASSISQQQRFSSGLTAALMWVRHSELTFEIPLLHNCIWCAQTGRGGWGLVLVLTSQMMVLSDDWWPRLTFQWIASIWQEANLIFILPESPAHCHLCSSQDPCKLGKKKIPTRNLRLLPVDYQSSYSNKVLSRASNWTHLSSRVKHNLSYPGKREAANGSASSACPLHPSCVKAVIRVWLHINHLQGCRSCETVNWSPLRPQRCTLWSNHTLAPDQPVWPPASIKRFPFSAAACTITVWVIKKKIKIKQSY